MVKLVSVWFMSECLDTSLQANTGLFLEFRSIFYIGLRRTLMAGLLFLQPPNPLSPRAPPTAELFVDLEVLSIAREAGESLLALEALSGSARLLLNDG
jgi:hypothetical protein